MDRGVVAGYPTGSRSGSVAATGGGSGGGSKFPFSGSWGALGEEQPRIVRRIASMDAESRPSGLFSLTRSSSPTQDQYGG